MQFNNILRGEFWHFVTVHDAQKSNQVVQWTLAAGAHTIEIAYRQAGALIDTVVIQSIN